MFSWIVGLILGGLPTWIWPALAGAGFAIYFFSGILAHMPQFKPYALFIKPLAGLIMVAGIFMYGGAGVTALYQEQIKEMEQKIALAEERSRSLNDLLEQKTKEKTRIIRDTQIIYKERIKEVEKRIDAECKVDPAANKILNDAASNPFKEKK